MQTWNDNFHNSAPLVDCLLRSSIPLSTWYMNIKKTKGVTRYMYHLLLIQLWPSKTNRLFMTMQIPRNYMNGCAFSSSDMEILFSRAHQNYRCSSVMNVNDSSISQSWLLAFEIGGNVKVDRKFTFIFWWGELLFFAWVFFFTSFNGISKGAIRRKNYYSISPKQQKLRSVMIWIWIFVNQKLGTSVWNKMHYNDNVLKHHNDILNAFDSFFSS